MKRFFARAAAVGLGGVLALSLCACNGKSEQLGVPAEVTALSYAERTSEGFQSYLRSVNAFSGKFAAACKEEGCDNFAVSPVSAYAALALSAQCAGGNTRSEILSALGCDYGTLEENFSKLYRVLDAEYKSEWGKLVGTLKFSNSVWLNEGTTVNGQCIEDLSQKFFAYSYSADFLGDNKGANKAVRSFVKDKTMGLIDQDFGLSPDTVFTLVNALYLKDVWNMYGDDLPFTANTYAFIQGDGTRKEQKLLRGDYRMGRTYENESYSLFYTVTDHGYKIKFLLPKVGLSAGEIYTAENLTEGNALSDYSAVDEENKIRYYTRCLFPEFKTNYNKNIDSVLRETFGIKDMFDFEKSDFSTLTDSAVFCAGVQHITELTVNKKGIEGAAVTVIPGAGSPGPGEYTEVYEDFVVDRAFAFVLSDWNDIPLFSGIVNTI